MTLPLQLQLWASSDTYSSGPEAGSPNKAPPPNHVEGWQPGEQLPSTLKNYVDHGLTGLSRWLTLLQLGNWQTAGQGGGTADSDTWQLLGMARNHRGHLIRISTLSAGVSPYRLGGDVGNLADPNQAVEAGPGYHHDSIPTGAPTTETPAIGAYAFDATKERLVVAVDNSGTPASCVDLFDFRDSAADRTGDYARAAAVTGVTEVNHHAITYDSALDEFYLAASAGTDLNVYRSQDKGATWTLQGTLVSTGFFSTAPTIGPAGRMLAITQSTSVATARVSLDGGATWTAGHVWDGVSDAPSGHQAIWSDAHGRFFVVRSGSGHPTALWSSVDGLNWIELFHFSAGGASTNGTWIGPTSVITLIADGPALVLFHNGRVDLTGDEDPGILYSLDAGSSWTPLTTSIGFSADFRPNNVFHDGGRYWTYRQGNAGNTEASQLMTTVFAGRPNEAITPPSTP